MKENRPIKLFADAHVFDNEYQGSRTFIKEIYSRLSLKENIELYLGAYDTEKLKKVFSNLPSSRFLKYPGRSRFTRLAYHIPYLLKRYKMDYAHFQYILPPTKSCSYIVSIHDVLFNDYPEEFSLSYRLFKNWLFRRAAHNADIITTVSAFSHNSILQHLNPPGRIHTIGNGVNPKYFEEYDRQKSRRYIAEKYNLTKYILCVSRFEPRKNQEALVRSFLQLQLYEQNYHLVLLGHKSLATPDFDNLMGVLPEQARKFIFISSHVDDEDLLEFYRAASLFVYPSKAEGFGIPPLEAAALKIPVICSNRSSMSSFTFFGEKHIDPCNEQQMNASIKDILEKKPNEAFLRLIAETIRSRYSWDESAEKLYQIILSHNRTSLRFKSEKYDQPAITVPL